MGWAEGSGVWVVQCFPCGFPLESREVRISNAGLIRLYQSRSRNPVLMGQR